jgi:deazaflavin-dependent oxidoreductase (nitroreductase family)
VASYNDPIIAEFRANGGRVGGMFAGVDLLLLTTTGARTGTPRTSPVGYAHDGARILVFATNNGQDRQPDWYRNLCADPDVTVELGSDTFPAYAVPLEGEERDRLFTAQGAALAAYQARTDRVIPVVALYPTRGAEGRAVALGDHLVKVHDHLRAQLAAARTGTRDSGVGGSTDLREHCLALCDALHEHHSREDAFFPTVRMTVPGLAPVLDRLRAEHMLVTDRIRRFRALLAQPPGDDVTAELDRLAADLEEHFAYEERMLVPALNLPAS